MTNKLSTERAIEALYTVRAYYASLTAGYPKGKDCRGIGDVMCSEIANSCLMAIKALEQQPSGDCISKQALEKLKKYRLSYDTNTTIPKTDVFVKIADIKELPSVTPKSDYSWKEIKIKFECDDCISRESVLDVINFEDEWLFDAESHNADTKIAFSTIKSKISKMPSVAPKQKVGKWIDTGIGKEELYGEMFVCSECNEVSYYENYCPRCGAKMEVEE